jgi:hypothetical protein
MNIRKVGAQSFHADGRTDTHDKANRRFFTVLVGCNDGNMQQTQYLYYSMYK